MPREIVITGAPEGEGNEQSMPDGAAHEGPLGSRAVAAAVGNTPGRPNDHGSASASDSSVRAVQVSHDAAPGEGLEPFASEAELQLAIRNPEYRRNPQFRAEVTARTALYIEAQKAAGTVSAADQKTQASDPERADIDTPHSDLEDLGESDMADWIASGNAVADLMGGEDVVRPLLDQAFETGDMENLEMVMEAKLGVDQAAEVLVVAEQFANALIRDTGKKLGMSQNELEAAAKFIDAATPSAGRSVVLAAILGDRAPAMAALKNYQAAMEKARTS